MTDFKDWLTVNESERQLYFDFMKVPEISSKQAREMQLIGPWYHGTTEDNRQKIRDTGFKVHVGAPLMHGMQLKRGSYIDGIDIPPPVQFLGFGIYFTSSPTWFKRYNVGTERGKVAYYIYAPRKETINFASTKKMFAWWLANGYDMPDVPNGKWTDPETEQQWIKSTENMTNVLKQKYDAVYYKGKNYGKRNLDNEQLVVFDPNNIFRVDFSDEVENQRQEHGLAAGDRILIKGTRATAVVAGFRAGKGNDLFDTITGKSDRLLTLTKFKDPNNTFLNTYYAPCVKAVLQSPVAVEFMKSRMSNRQVNASVEQEAESYVQYYLTRGILMNFPNSLVERVLKPGERVKS